MKESVVGLGPLAKIYSGGWMPFLNFVTLLRKNEPLHQAYKEIQDAWGNIDEKTLRAWRRAYQEGLKQANLVIGLLQIGGANPQEIIVVDESNIGVLMNDEEESMSHGGISKGARRVRSSSRSRTAFRARVSKVLPARTIWKRPASMKRPATRGVMKRPAALKRRPAGAIARQARSKKPDARSSGRWLWAAVSVGYDQTRFTHGNGLKRFAWKILPPKYEAVKGRPRGTEEIKKAMVTHIAQGSKLVFDGWLSSAAAATEAGFEFAPPVVHDVSWRDAETGWHSNDIESEFSRLKHWNRVRHGSLMVDELDLHEYTFTVNGGREMTDIMLGLCTSVGGRPFLM